MKKQNPTSIDLLLYEHMTWAKLWPTHTTLTFLNSGNIPYTYEHLKARIKLILKANPFLTGRLINEQGKTKLIYNENVDIDEVIDQYFFMGETSRTLRASPNSEEYLEAVKTAKPYALPKAPGQINNPDGQLLRFVLVPMENCHEANCALVMSMSHHLGDGYTKFAIYGMINPNVDIVALDPTRITDMEFFGMQKMLMGGRAIINFWPENPLSFIGPMINRFIRGQTFVKCFNVDTTTDGPVSVVKAKYANTNGVEYVSTGDIISSAFLKATKCAYGGTTVNTRFYAGERAKEAMVKAGNYSLPLVYRPADYDNPALMRKSLKNDKDSNRPIICRASNPKTRPPKILDFMQGNCSFFTNISNPDPDLKIPNCNYVRSKTSLKQFF